jgi:hypothetical protein
MAVDQAGRSQSAPVDENLAASASSLGIAVRSLFSFACFAFFYGLCVERVSG